MADDNCSIVEVALFFTAVPRESRLVASVAQRADAAVSVLVKIVVAWLA
jgi:hypothetical protein